MKQQTGNAGARARTHAKTEPHEICCRIMSVCVPLYLTLMSVIPVVYVKISMWEGSQ